MIRPFFPLRRWAIRVFLKQRQWRTHAAYGPVRVSEILDLLSLSPSLSFPVPVADDGSIYAVRLVPEGSRVPRAGDRQTGCHFHPTSTHQPLRPSL